MLDSELPWMLCGESLSFFNEFGFQRHRSDASDFAVDVVIASNNSDVLHLGANFDNAAVVFQVFNDDDRIAVFQHVAIRITRGVVDGGGSFVGG